MAKKIGEEPQGNNSMADENEAYRPQEQDARKRRGKVISWIVIAVAVAVLVFALVQIMDIKSEDWAGEKAYDNLKAAAEPSEAADPRDRKIDFDALKAINQDIIGWIYIPDTKIDYPVVIGTDNDYYISHNADQSKNRAGAIFLDYQNAPDFSDQNTIIYGHRMNDGSMFADLHNYEKEDFFRKHDTVYLYLPDGTLNEYKVFSAYITSAEGDNTYTMSFASDEAYKKYLQEMQARSPFATEDTLSARDKMITLSTCVRYQDDNRYVVQAVLQK